MVVEITKEASPVEQDESNMWSLGSRLWI